MNMEDVINLPSCSEHTQRNTHKASCYERCLRELNRNERRMRGIQGGKKKKKEIKGGEKPMWWREILILSEIIRSLPPSTFPFIASFLFSISALPFYQPVPSLSSAFPYLLLLPVSLHSPFTAFTLSYYPSLYSTSLALSLSLSESCRQTRQHALMLLYLTRHTHTLSCTHIWETGRGEEGTRALRHTGWGLELKSQT